MKRLSLFFAGLFMLLQAPAYAENMIMLRVPHSFDSTMILLKEKLGDYGYKVAHIQKCDTGLSDFDYKTDLYKVVFFGKFEEIRQLTRDHPELMPYLPLKIAVMKEKESVVLVALNPDILAEFFPDQALMRQFGRWESDIRAVYEEIAEAKPL